MTSRKNRAPQSDMADATSYAANAADEAMNAAFQKAHYEIHGAGQGFVAFRHYSKEELAKRTKAELIDLFLAEAAEWNALFLRRGQEIEKWRGQAMRYDNVAVAATGRAAQAERSGDTLRTIVYKLVDIAAPRLPSQWVATNQAEPAGANELYQSERDYNEHMGRQG